MKSKIVITALFLVIMAILPLAAVMCSDIKSDSGQTSEIKSESDNNYNFNRYLKRLKKTNFDNSAYRLIGVFDNKNEKRYASIKIENPNPTRDCNLGGDGSE